MTIRKYSDLRRLPTIEERYNYLALRSGVGQSTFGSERYLNQNFYRSREWKLIRDEVINRDHGCDLGVEGYEIYDRIIIHHMNPMTIEDIERGDEAILDPRFLISTTHRTHNAIHFGDERQLPRQLVERTPGDTTLW